MLLEAVAKAIEKSDKTRYRIAQDTGVNQTVLFRLVNGGSCNVATLDTLCEHLDLKLVSKTKKVR